MDSKRNTDTQAPPVNSCAVRNITVSKLWIYIHCINCCTFMHLCKPAPSALFTLARKHICKITMSLSVNFTYSFAFLEILFWLGFFVLFVLCADLNDLYCAAAMYKVPQVVLTEVCYRCYQALLFSLFCYSRSVFCLHFQWSFIIPMLSLPQFSFSVVFYRSTWQSLNLYPHQESLLMTRQPDRCPTTLSAGKHINTHTAEHLFLHYAQHSLTQYVLVL